MSIRRAAAALAAVGLMAVSLAVVGVSPAAASDSPAGSDMAEPLEEGSGSTGSATDSPGSGQGSMSAESGPEVPGFGQGSADSAPGEAESEGLVGGPELDGGGGGGEVPPLGPVDGGGFGVGDDGVYSWDDGGRVIGVRRVAAATADGVGGAVGGAPDPSVEHPNATGGEWFVTDTGQLLLLHGGVIVLFAAGASPGEVLARHGVSLADAEPIGGLEGGFLVPASPEESLALAAALAAEPEVVSASPNWSTPNTVEQVGGRSPSGSTPPDGGTGGSLAQGFSAAQKQHCTGYAPRSEWVYSDELHHCAWHFDAGTSYRAHGTGQDPRIDINIGDVWDTTKGQGVHIAIVDHHWNGGHEDLRDNVDSARSTDWGGHTSEPSWWRKGLFLHNGRLAYGRYLYTERHGTWVAGVAGARDNDVGSRGVAPRARLVNFNLLDDDTAARLIESWTGHSDVVGVSNHSYTAGRLANLKRASNTWWTAVDGVLTNGLGGLGTVFTMSAGNSRNNGFYGGFSVLDERKSHRGVMTVCAVGPDGTQASYSNEGPNLWLCAPSRAGSSGIGIIAPEGSNGYRDDFGGTSAAGPQVAGAAALVRSVNPQLTWRDTRLILADTAAQNHTSDSSWLTGAATYSDPNSSYKYSHRYGFGVVDAEAAVDKAFAWPLLPAEQTSRTASTAAASLSDGTRRTEYTLNVTTAIDFVEHVYLELDMTTEKLREFDITLISPAGRQSQMLTHAPNCYRPYPSYHNCPLSGMFRFGTVRHLGENPAGAWKLRFDYRGTLKQAVHAQDIATLNSWALSIHGHTKASSLVVAPGVSFTVGTGNATDTTLTEGDSLTITANLHNSTPAQDLTVPVGFARQSAAGYTSGSADFAAASVTFPAGQTTATTTATIIDDALPEGDEVFAVRADLAGYHTLGVTHTITVADDDDGPPPKVWIEGGKAVTEGAGATFTITAFPATPTSGSPATLPVIVEVTQSGDPGAATGKRTVLVPVNGPAGGTAQFIVSTTDDNVDEPDGAVTATIRTDPAYTIQREAATVDVEDNDQAPVVTISGGAAVTEGSAATFTVTALPAVPASLTPAALSVAVEVTQSGDFGTATGTRTVAVDMSPTTGGTAQFTVTTADDYADEPDGTVTATLQPDPSYVLGGTRAASVGVEDDDLPLTVTVSGGPAVTEGSTATFTVTVVPATPTAPVPATLPVTVKVTQRGDFGAATGTRTVTVPLSQTTGGTATFTVTTADDDFDEPDGAVRAAVQLRAGYILGGVSVAEVGVADDDPTPPVVSISGGAGVTEGADAVFTLTATPSDPASGTPATLPVTVEVTHFLGDPGADIGTHTVTMTLSPTTGGTAQLTVGTTDDEVDERDGIVLASVRPGAGYILGDVSIAGVGVVDNDDPGPKVTVSGGAGVTEGDDAVFTVSASPAPTADLPVKVTVGQTGDYGAVTGTRTVTVPAGGSVKVTVGTANDGSDEADGSVSVTVQPGAGYTVGSPSSAQVAVADDDPTLPEVSITGGPGIAEGDDATFTVSAVPKPTGPLPVNVAVSQIGHHGTDMTLKSVTVPAGGSVTFTVSTVADQVDEADGYVTVTVKSGTGYTVSPTKGWASVAVTDDGPGAPVVSIAASGDVTEGGDAVFTVSASPAPATALPVKLLVSQSGDFGVSTGARTVSVPVGGSVSVTVGTTDDSTDEADGSVTVAVQSGSGYTVSSAAGSATAAVADDDGPATGYTVDPQVVARVKELAAQVQHGSAHVNRWQRVLVAFGEMDGAGVSGGAMSAAQAQQMADVHSSPVWDLVVVELTALEAAKGGTPVVSIAAGGGVTEGGSATFTVTAVPAPASGLPVQLSVSQVGDFGAATGPRTVTVPAGGSVKVTVATTGDGVDEADGSVTATVVAGSGYTVSSTAGDASVAVADDDDPPVVVPVVSISADGGVTEGGSATFTVTAVPAPASGLPVQLSVSQVGDFGAATGPRTVTVPVGGSVSVTVATTGDGVDEADGSVTATVVAGSGYTVSSAAGAASVAVADDDDPPVVVPVVSISADGDVTEGSAAVFTVSAVPAPSGPLPVDLSVSQSGDFGVTTGARTVTVPVGGSVSVTVATTDDGVDEADGSVTATVVAGSGYTVSSAAGDATVAVADDDDPPPPAEAVSVSLSASVVSIPEAGGEARITVTLGRALEVGEWVQAPLAVTGGAEGDHWTMEMRAGDNPAGGAWQTGYGEQPEVLFYGGGRTATLVLTARPDADTADRTITIAFGTGSRAPVSGGLAGGIEIGVSTVSVTIIDDD